MYSSQHHFESMFNYILRCTSTSISPFLPSIHSVKLDSAVTPYTPFSWEVGGENDAKNWCEQKNLLQTLIHIQVMVGSSNLTSSVAVYRLPANIPLIKHLWTTKLLFPPCFASKFNLNSSKWKFYLVEVNKHIWWISLQCKRFHRINHAPHIPYSVYTNSSHVYVHASVVEWKELYQIHCIVAQTNSVLSIPCAINLIRNECDTNSFNKMLFR